MKALSILLVMKKGEIIKRLCFILPQMNGYIKYFENGSKNISFFIKDDDVLYKYKEIWDKVKGGKVLRMSN